jgi:beta-xylosidase
MTTILNKSLLILALFTSSVIQAQEYPKVILRGDYPDPSIIREGKDYYMTHSPFYYLPGFLILHSQDLVHWEPVCRPLVKNVGSAMAPDLVKHNGRYYIYFPASGTNWVIWADDIRGQWSDPVDLKVGGIDPGHIVGEDGKRYLHLSAGAIVQLSDDGLSVVGKPETVYEGWEYPKDWNVECMCLESPKLIQKDGYFYLISAEGGTAGPATSHAVVAARSRSVKGPWENAPNNPIVHTYSSEEQWWSKGHGTLIDDVNGNWWIVYHAYERNYHSLGRQTLLEPIEWTNDGWLETTTNARPAVTVNKGLGNGLVLSDNFDNQRLGLQWTAWKSYNPKEISLQNGQLSLKGRGNSPGNGQLLLTTASDKSYEVNVEVNLRKNGSGGLILFYNEKAYAGITGNGNQFTVYENADKQTSYHNAIGKKFFLKIINRSNLCEIQVSKNGTDWDTLIADLNLSDMHHNKLRGFFALRPGLVALGNSDISFDNFNYRPLPYANPEEMKRGQVIDSSKSKAILTKYPKSGIYATGHHSILQQPDFDEWHIIYHRFSYPDAIKMGREAGYYREVCIDKLEFNEDGSIKPVKITL